MSDKMDQLAEAAEKFREQYPHGIMRGNKLEIRCTHDFRMVYPTYSKCYICGMKWDRPSDVQ